MSDDPARPRAISLEPGDGGKAPQGARAYRLEEDGKARSGEGARVAIEASPELEVKQVVDLAAEDKGNGFFSWSSLFWSAVTLLVGAYLADGIHALYLSMEKASPWLGQAVLGLVGIVVLGILVFLVRELLAILQMRKVGKLRARALELIAAPDRASAGVPARPVVILCARSRRDGGAGGNRAGT